MRDRFKVMTREEVSREAIRLIEQAVRSKNWLFLANDLQELGYVMERSAQRREQAGSPPGSRLASSPPVENTTKTAAGFYDVHSLIQSPAS